MYDLVYHEIYKNPPQGLKEAILRIVPRIDVRFLTTAIVETTPEMSNIRKTYLAKALDIRSQRILIPAWKRARKEMPLSLEEGRSR